MNLREALDLCTDDRAHEWVKMPSGGWGRPATTMLAGVFNPGGDNPETRPLMGHSLAVYVPDVRLSLVWPMPEDTDYHGRAAERFVPEWAEQDTHEFKNARSGWAVVMLSGAPIWQARVWYLDWGSGVGGYVPAFEPRYAEADEDGRPKLEGWEVPEWDVHLAGLINSFLHTNRDWGNVDPTYRIVPSPSKLHPIDAARGVH